MADHPTPADLVAAVNDNLGELATTMGVQITTASHDELRAVMPVSGNRQPYGLLHGGASAVLAETTGSIMAALLAPEGHPPVGIELSCTHHRSAREGLVEAVCTPVTVGRTLATFAIAISDDDERLLCTARLTCLYRAPRQN